MLVYVYKNRDSILKAFTLGLIAYVCKIPLKEYYCMD